MVDTGIELVVYRPKLQITGTINHYTNGPIAVVRF